MTTAKAEMLIRKPVAEVFEAFVEPAITSRFAWTSWRIGSPRDWRNTHDP